MKSVYTTGQVAKFCKVAPRTVSKWFDSGQLRGYKIPGSQDRRIPPGQLLKFLKEHGMPIRELEHDIYSHVLIVGTDEETLNILRNHLREIDDFRLQDTTSIFEAGLRAESFDPDCIIVDMAIGYADAKRIVENLRISHHRAATVLIRLTDKISARNAVRLDFSDTFKKPFEGFLLAECIKRLIEKKKAAE